MGEICLRSGVKENEVEIAYGGDNFNHNQIKANAENRLMTPSQVKEIMEKRIEEAADDFYDGISRFTRVIVLLILQVLEVSSGLGKAGSVGLGKAVEALDTLRSSVTSLNPSAGFASRVVIKGNELSILAFKVANTIVKGSNLMQSLSRGNIGHLKEVVLAIDGVQNLISKDIDELLRIVAVDKRISRELTPQKQLKEEAELVIE
ncbi:hypothetical protein CRYUN_Cryun17cG0064300 [Craigia yunnanensis]